MKSYRDRPLIDYLDEAASGKPTPGGGSVAALAGALSAAMASMVANFTVGKEKFRAVEEEVRRILASCEELRKKLLALVDADTEVYATVSKAYGLPRETEEEKKRRSEEIQKACREALSVPMDVARACRAILDHALRLAAIGNPGLVSDAGVSAVLAEAALAAAALNVEINLASLKDESFVRERKQELEPMLRDATRLRNEIVSAVRRKIGAV